MLAELVRMVFEAVGISGVSATVLLALLLVLAYGSKLTTVGGVASRGITHIQVVAVVLLLLFGAGLIAPRTERAAALWEWVQAVEWRALLEGWL